MVLTSIGANDATDHNDDRAAAYRNFIGALRDVLVCLDTCKVHIFRVLHDASTLQYRQLFLQVFSTTMEMPPP
ncbi:hypothetical protein ACFX13_044966 [Malus domestica]